MRDITILNGVFQQNYLARAYGIQTRMIADAETYISVGKVREGYETIQRIDRVLDDLYRAVVDEQTVFEKETM